MHAAVSLPTELPTCAGFKQAGGGATVSRTIMLAELTTLLGAMPSDTRFEGYRAAIIDDNVLGKRSLATRRESLRRLSEFYALDPAMPLFFALRRLWDADSVGRPLLACLAANARDPLLRLTAPTILTAPFGAPISAAGLAAAIEDQVVSVTSTIQVWTMQFDARGRLSRFHQRLRAALKNPEVLAGYREACAEQAVLERREGTLDIGEPTSDVSMEYVGDSALGPGTTADCDSKLDK